MAPVAFLAGFYASNVVSTVREKLFGQSSVSDRVAHVESFARNPNDQSDLAILARKAVLHNLKQLNKKIDELEHQQSDFPGLSVFESYIVSSITS